MTAAHFYDVRFNSGVHLNPEETARQIVERVSEFGIPRLMLAGAPSVGKSRTRTHLEAAYPGLCWIEQDAIPRTIGEGLSPCSKTGFDPEQCFGARLPSTGPFVCDIGGDNVFYRRADNSARCLALKDFKSAHRICVVVLETTQDEHASRYRESRPRADEVVAAKIWAEWVEVQRPFWLQLHDVWLVT